MDTALRATEYIFARNCRTNGSTVPRGRAAARPWSREPSRWTATYTEEVENGKVSSKGHTGGDVSFHFWAWMFPVAIALHNLEEAIWLPAWSKIAGKWHRPVSSSAFRFAVAVLTALAVVVTAWAVLAGPQSVGAYLLAGYALAMLLNVVMPHVLATMVLRRYMPGLSTALALNLPVTILLLRSSFAQGYVSFPTFVYYGVAVCAALVISIPVLFRIGEKVGSRSTPFHPR